jgi:alkylation response protein AidB-like acyl-CoA dehydrogenase
MILEHRNDLDAFRRAVRDWLRANIPADWRARILEDEAALQRNWMTALIKAGIATPHWPEKYGGAGLGFCHQVIIADEMAQAEAPPTDLLIVSHNHVPATFLSYGSEWQKDTYLPGVSRDGDIWCQGFSEPGAGSDLASLRTRAVRDGDSYVINGQKVWSSFASHARYCLLLARTDTTVKKHAGISYFVMDMKAPGLEVRPIRQATGDSEFCELFMTDVRIPLRDRIGEEGQGWQVAQATLAAERGILSFAQLERIGSAFEAFHRQAVEMDAAWLRDDQLRREYMSLLADMQAVRRLTRKAIREGEREDYAPSMTPAFVKLIGTDLNQRIGDFRTRVLGLDGQADLHGAMYDYVNSFGWTISGGANEIMRNIIAERGLGMPR